VGQHATKRYLGELKRGAGWAAVAVTLVSTGVQAAVLKASGLEDAVTLLQLFFRTAPLTVAVAVIAELVADAADSAKDRWFVTLLYSAGVLWAATLIGGALGGLQIRPEPVLTGGEKSVNPAVWAAFYLVNMLAGYFKAYGDGPFLSSLILGGFLFWAWRRYGEVTVAAAQATRTAAAPATPADPPATPAEPEPTAAGAGRRVRVRIRRGARPRG
jgi:hypothetical protein